MMHFCNPNDVVPLVWKKNSLKDKIKWRCDIFMRNKERHGLSPFSPWNSTHELVFGMKLSSSLSTELTKYSIFPVQVPCLFNWWASLRGECGQPWQRLPGEETQPLLGRFPCSQQVQPRSRWSFCGTRLVLRSDIASVPGKTKKMHQKAPRELWSTSSSWIKRSTGKKCAACGNGNANGTWLIFKFKLLTNYTAY